MKVIKIEPRRSPAVIELDKTKRLYVAMAEAIGCELVEIVGPKGLKGKYCFICDESALLKDEPMINPLPSYLYGYCDHGHPICNTVLVMKEELGPDGIDLVCLNEEDERSLMSFLNQQFVRACVKVEHAIIEFKYFGGI